LAGDHVGPEAITAMLTRARSSPEHEYRPELDMATSDRHAVAIYRVSGSRNGEILDLDQLLLMRVEEDGRIVEVTAYRRKQAVYNELWS